MNGQQKTCNLNFRYLPSAVLIALMLVRPENSWNKEFKSNITGLRIPTGRRQTSWLFTSVTEDLNSGLPRTNPASVQGGTWTRGLRIVSPTPQPLGHAASSLVLQHCCKTSWIPMCALYHPHKTCLATNQVVNRFERGWQNAHHRFWTRFAAMLQNKLSVSVARSTGALAARAKIVLHLLFFFQASKRPNKSNSFQYKLKGTYIQWGL